MHGRWQSLSLHKGRSTYVDHRSPYGQLLRTCKDINEEAEPVLYGNTFVLMTFNGVEKFFKDCLYNQSLRLWLRPITIKFFFIGLNVDRATQEARSSMTDEDVEGLLDHSPNTRFMRISHKMVIVRTTDCTEDRWWRWYWKT